MLNEEQVMITIDVIFLEVVSKVMIIKMILNLLLHITVLMALIHVSLGQCYDRISNHICCMVTYCIFTNTNMENNNSLNIILAFSKQVSSPLPSSRLKR